MHFRLKDLLMRLLMWLLKELLDEFSGDGAGSTPEG